MASEGDHIGFRADEDVSEKVAAFEARRGYESRSKAVQDMIRVAARETRSPLLYRLKDEVATWAGALSVIAVVIVTMGVTTDPLAPVHAIQMAVVLLGFATVLLGGYEAARVVTGQSELGERVREVVR